MDVAEKDSTSSSPRFSVSSWKGQAGPSHSTPIRSSCSEELIAYFPKDHSTILPYQEENLPLSTSNSIISDSFMHRCIQNITASAEDQQIALKLSEEFERLRKSRRSNSLDSISRRLTARRLSPRQNTINDDSTPRKSRIEKVATTENTTGNLADGKNERVSTRPPSSASNFEIASIVSTKRANNLITSSLGSTVNFGFVSTGALSELINKIYNNSTDILQLRFFIEDDIRCRSDENDDCGSVFQVNGATNRTIRGGESTNLKIIFRPKLTEKYVAKLVVERENGEQARFPIKLVGYGGRAGVQLSKDNFLDGIVSSTNAPGSFVLTPNNYGSFQIRFENSGERSAFVAISLVPDFDNHSPIRHSVTIHPERFVLEANKQKTIRIRVNQSVGWRNGEQIPNYIFSMCNGEEIQRQWLKNSPQKSKIIIDGVCYTDKFEGEFIDSKNSHHKKESSEMISETDFASNLRCIKLKLINSSSAFYFSDSSVPDVVRSLVNGRSVLHYDLQNLPAQKLPNEMNIIRNY